MTITIMDYFNQLLSNPALLVTTILTLGVIFVNGWTDAPNSIATCVATRSLSPKRAIALAAAFDFLGILVMTSVNSTVAQTIYRMVDFKGNPQHSLVALCAAMVAIVTWAVAAWRIGIPTSEGHAMIAGITGAAIALQGGFEGINPEEWIKVIYGLVLSVSMGLGLGFVISRITEHLFRYTERRKSTAFFQKAQIAASAGMAFMHGAQDGQKFMGVFMLGAFLASGDYGTAEFRIPLWLMIMCSAVMTSGTMIGGYRIIKTIGMRMVKLETYQGFSADAAAASSLLLSSLLGFPVSTTHAKSTAIIGVGISRKISSVNWELVADLVLTWVFTFPGCGLLGYVMAQLFIRLFG
ncbi:MAG: inorganic phosphate transporter [Firmicutes bacterium]|nr:inorganic phosphate transporter [Bacillota bacterium]